MPEFQEDSLAYKFFKNNLISEEQAKVISEKQKQQGGNAVEHILNEGFMDEKQILAAITTQFGFHYINLDKIEIDKEALSEIPMELVKKLKVLPIRRTKNMLAVTMVDPLDANIRKSLAGATACTILPFVSTGKQIEAAVKQLTAPQTATKVHQEGMSLIEEYTFENFVSGKSNEFPYAISMAVAKSPGKTYNPLFLYSNVGLGKTHLMNAIGNYLKKENPSIKILYATCEYFCSRVVEAIKDNSIADLRESFRQLDLLLIDDIQFLGGRENAQEEFFHIFNSLVQNHKQIVITNDRPPSELTVLQKRLQSRFMGGTVASIDLPDLETRMAILDKKSADIKIPQDVQRLLAEKFHSSIRDLEGALKTLLSFHRFTKAPIDHELVQHTLREMGR